MAATTPEVRQNRRMDPFDRRRGSLLALARPVSVEGVRVSWGGIWGGVLTALGLLILLAALGAAVGITATNPQQADVAKIGIAAGAWIGISLLIALFVGGMVTTRIGATFDGATGFWEGALVWIVTLLLMGYLATTSLGSLMGGALRVMGGATQAAATAAQGTTAANNAANAAANASPSAVIGRLKERIDTARANGTVERKAAEVQPMATKASWGAFIALILSLASAVLGAMAGRRPYPLPR